MSNELIERLRRWQSLETAGIHGEAADTIEAQQKRIEELKDKLFDAKGKASEKRIELICNLAAAQAQLVKLRKALKQVLCTHEYIADDGAEAADIAHKALAQPSDDSALREMLRQEREKAIREYDERNVPEATRSES